MVVVVLWVIREALAHSLVLGWVVCGWAAGLLDGFDSMCKRSHFVHIQCDDDDDDNDDAVWH